LSTLLCVVYGMMHWNKDDEATPPVVDQTWEKEEIEIEEKEEGL
jgi:hypothetical protein